MSDGEGPTKIIPDLLGLIPDLPADSIVSRTVYRDGAMRVMLFAFAAGEALSEHTSSYPAVLHFLGGRATVTLGAESISATTGTWIHMPPRLPHSITAGTACHMLLLMFQGDTNE